MVEVLVVLIGIVLVVIALLPMLNAYRTTERRMSSNTQLRPIHQTMIMYAQSNNLYFPGLDANGQPISLATEDRLKLLVDSNHLPPDSLISSADRDKQTWATGPFTSDHYSFALLQVSATGGRYEEWRETLNPKAIVITDRNVGSAAVPQSIHTRNPGDWRGGVVRNDNSVSFETTHLHDTEYAGHAHTDDHLFEATGENDAYFIHSGN